MLRDIESKLAGLVEGTFGRLFRSEVTPAELARGLAREMEATRRSRSDGTWVAGRYDVFLSPSDHRKVAGGEQGLVEQLSNGLLLYAREQRFALPHTPVVSLHREDRLSTGRYGVRATHDAPPEAAPSPGRDAATPRDAAPRSPAERPREPVDRPREGVAPAAPRAGSQVLVQEGRREIVPATGATIGRSRECQIVIASPEVSREHAELRPNADGWTIFDLGSTNGVRVNGTVVGGPASPAAVGPGDRINLGTVVLRVEAAA